MKKLKYIFFMTLVLTAVLFSSCVDRVEATKYTTDTLHKKSGKDVKGIILSDQGPFFTIREGKSSNIMNVMKSDVSSFGYSDHVFQKDGDIVSCSVEIMGLDIVDENGDPIAVSLAQINQIDCSQGLENVQVRTMDGRALQGKITSEYIDVVTTLGHKRIKTDLIGSVRLGGTPKEEDQSIADLWNDLAQNMGVQNVVPKSDTGRKDNGWLFTLIGVLVVFVALAFMVIVFSLMKNLSSDKKRSNKSADATSDKKVVEVKDGEIHPDVVSAIALTLALSEGEEKPRLTFDKNKASGASWSFSGKVDGTKGSGFRRG